MFEFSRTSLARLNGVRPDLADVVRGALKISDIDFAVVDGLRTLDEQREYVAKGVSHTLESKHLPQGDGYSHAVDLVPIVNGKARWEMKPIYSVAWAMREAAAAVGLSILWGGCWTENLTDSAASPSAMADAYVDLRKSQGRTPFIDGPHYEIAK